MRRQFIVMKVITVNEICSDEFDSICLKGKNVLLMKKAASNWSASKKWNLEYFQQLSHDFKVHVEDGNVMQNETHFHKESFFEYLQGIKESEEKFNQGLIPYLSFFDIFENFSCLEEDVDFSILSKKKFYNRIFAWIGPRGTRTGYHIDWSDNLLAQIVGRKEVRIVAPEYSACMYSTNKFDFGSTLSAVDPLNWDKDKYPKFKDVTEETIILEAGDILFIPKGCWHHITSLDTSISVNNFGISLKDFLYYGAREHIKKFFHDMGLYAKDNCTCHIYVDGKRVKK